MAVTNTWTNPTALDRNTGQTIREQDWDGVLSDLMVLGGTTGSSGVNKYQLLTNGGFEFWQRGPGPFVPTPGGTGLYGPDRWFGACGVGSTQSLSRDTANTDVGSNACCAVTYTHSATSTVSQTVVLSGSEHALKGRTITVSIRVRCGVANSVRIRVNDGVSGIQYSAYHTGGGSYETLSLTYALASTSTQFSFNVELNASGTYYLDNAMLVVGNVAADYAPLHPADDLARCLRYYEVIGESQTTVAFSAYGTAGGVIQFAIPYKARKAVSPTATKVGTWTVSNCAQPTLGGGLDSLYIQSNVTALGMAQFYNGSAGNSITLESNP